MATVLTAFSVNTRPIPVLPNQSPTLIVLVRNIHCRRLIPSIIRRISSYQRTCKAPRNDITANIREILNRNDAISGPSTECVVRHVYGSEAQCERLVEPGLIDRHDDVCGYGNVGFDVDVEMWC
jgi:hypothetical protein